MTTEPMPDSIQGIVHEIRAMVDTAVNGDAIAFCENPQWLLTLMDQLARLTKLNEQAPEGTCAHCGGDVWTAAEIEEVNREAEKYAPFFSHPEKPTK